MTEQVNAGYKVAVKIKIFKREQREEKVAISEQNQDAECGCAPGVPDFVPRADDPLSKKTSLCPMTRQVWCKRHHSIKEQTFERSMA